ncbi:PQQ-dependent sugar dehydrogenase [Winogradskyella echinorum]|uniref:PQQ-dependent sugar dehydrogenase n=1 Tax=Winogradskyella echinorum TaxID=538189 RepID=A0ABR6Y5M3_9FLAO|nr:PQQ-dependent sugar dehydrogenase [Winogradskyella echinorum]MBC3848049.1 PQQ-dependent sugar dehydrogenase [Winogradskyella echinorum]MBC5752397.1 PQQ-dependent sugar dehydrogenase [Winogradskyella echinorum]
MKTSITLVLTLSFIFSFAQDLELNLFASGLNRPVNIKHAGDTRLFVAEQQGIIKIINSDGSIESTPFLDITNLVYDTGSEQGLLGLAFHPDYATNGYFFVNYINNLEDTVISRFTRNESNPSIADPSSELEILTFAQPYVNHNGGELQFGSDGFLYISSGDGGDGGDPQNNSQNLTNLLGTILRIDVNNSTIANPYDIPTDNPFVSNSVARDEIWAYGLRNPWKFSFDSSNNDMWIADVGQSAKEEINQATSSASGLNYGWRCYEGNNAFNTIGCPNSSTLTFPVSEYAHVGGRCSITGGYVYRGSMYPNFDGLYFFADVCTQEIGYLKFENENWNSTFESFSGSFVAFGEDINGELYVSTLSGNIFKLVDNALSTQDNLLNSISIYPNPTKNELNINFENTNTSVNSTKLIIYNIHGEVIKTINRTAETIQKVNTSDLSAGIYILKISTENHKQSIHKIVIN